MKPQTADLFSLWNTLTPREMQIARLVAQGKRNVEIAQDLGLSWLTVATHLKHIFGKLRVRSRTELANVVHNVAEER